MIIDWGLLAAPDMPGMDMGTNGGPAASALAGLPLFSAVASLHILRLLSAEQLPDADRLEDAGHLAMGAGMTVMVFPGVDGTVLHSSAVLFAVLALAFFTRAWCHRGPVGNRKQSAAIGTGQAAMAYMFAAPAHPAAWMTATVAGALAVCALVHGRRVIDARHGTPHEDTPHVSRRLLVTLPHTGTLVTTVAMAWMVVIA